MKKKILSLLLTFSLLLSLCPAALAAEDGVRETNLFSDQPHADVDFADMTYRHIESGPILEEMEEIRKLLPDGANEKEVEEAFLTFADQFMEVLTMYKLVFIRTYQDVTDEEAAAEHEYATTLYATVADALILLIQDILESPCGGFLREQLSEEDIAYYTEYEAMTEEQLARSTQESALVNEYLSAAHQTYTAEYEGKSYDDASLAAALESGEVDQDVYIAISRDIAKNQNAALGDIYLRMAALRKEISKSAGYDNYADYAYTEIYQRDYTQQEIRSFHQAVKDEIVPLSNALTTLYYYESADPVFSEDYAGDTALDVIEPYIGRLSSEMAEAFAYMRGHGLYDIGYSDTKGEAGFTTTLDSYGAPFYFNRPTGDIYDLSTAIHEFGHYNDAYWQSAGWNDGDKPLDISEVHSQALELLFTHFYEDIFESEESAEAVQDYLILNLLSSAIIYGCLFDELQQYVYATDNVTLEQINREFCQLCREYGIIPEDDERTEMYSWYEVPHTFTQPCYYISYAVSAAGAFAFWLDAQDDYFAAVDDYLKFTSLDSSYGFQESFAELGIDSPIDPQYVEDLADALWEALEVEERCDALSPLDISGEEWFGPAALALYAAGLIEKDDSGCIHPELPGTWNDAAALLTVLAGQPYAAKEDGKVITRAEFAEVIAALLELPDNTESPFPDTDDGAVAALAVRNIVSGYSDGTFRPDASILRAEMWVVTYRALMNAASQLIESAAG